MSKLILGTANFSQPYGIKNGKQIDEKEIENILQMAVDNGVYAVDISTAYVCKDARPVKIIKSIKCVKDYYHYRSCHELSHGFDKINDGQWDGVSVDTPEEALKAAKMKMSIIQFPLNVFDHDIMRTKFFRSTRKHKIATMARSVFLQGLLLMDDPPIGKEYIQRLDDTIRLYGISRKEAAFLFVYGNPNIDYVVIGVDTAEQLKELLSLTKYELPWSLTSSIYDINDVPEQIKYPWLWRQ
jgi:aryl-alcohol dehydrogenase-like predicted oxidoreductase